VTPHRVLITGGAGFLGAHLAHHFRKEEVPVRLFDLAECPAWSSEIDAEYIRGDIRNAAAIDAALDGVDTVVHAAFASPRQSREEIESVNAGGTQNVCARAITRGVRRFILISSTIVQKPRRVHPLFQNSPLTRLDLYRKSRVEAEKLASEHRSKGLKVAIVRPKTFFGPERVGAFAIIFECIRLGKPVPVLGSGRNRYQLLDIRDMTEGIRLLTASDATGVSSFGAREFRTVREDLQALLDNASTGARLRFVPAPFARAALRCMEVSNIVPLSEWHYTSASGEDSVVDISRAEWELGWQPERSNAQALVEAYDWYVKSIMTNGTARTAHPVPLMHQALKGLIWIFPQ